MIEPNEQLLQVEELLHEIHCFALSDDFCGWYKAKEANNANAKIRQFWLRRAQRFLKAVDSDAERAIRILELEASWHKL